MEPLSNPIEELSRTVSQVFGHNLSFLIFSTVCLHSHFFVFLTLALVIIGFRRIKFLRK